MTEPDSDAVRRLRERANARAAGEPVPDQPAGADAEPPAAEPAAAGSVAVEPAAVEPAAPERPADVAAEAAGTPAASATRGRRQPFTDRLTTALVVTVVLAVVAAALATVVAARLSHRNDVADARLAALGAATSGVATVLSYDYRHLGADFAKAEALLTPRFRKQYAATTAKAVQPLAAKYRAISSADVTAGGVVQASGSRAVVLVLVSQTVTNTQLAAPRLDRSRIDVTLIKTGGRWLIDRLDTL